MWMENDACACHVTWFVGVSAGVINPKMVNFTTTKNACVSSATHVTTKSDSGATLNKMIVLGNELQRVIVYRCK